MKKLLLLALLIPGITLAEQPAKKQPLVPAAGTVDRPTIIAPTDVHSKQVNVEYISTIKFTHIVMSHKPCDAYGGGGNDGAKRAVAERPDGTMLMGCWTKHYPEASISIIWGHGDWTELALKDVPNSETGFSIAAKN